MVLDCQNCPLRTPDDTADQSEESCFHQHARCKHICYNDKFNKTTNKHILFLHFTVL